MKNIFGILLMIIGVLLFIVALSDSDVTTYIVAATLCGLGFWLYRLAASGQKNAVLHTVAYNNLVRCPKCGSASILADKKGYSTGKGCCGFFMCGPLGFLFGQMGANKIRKTCLNCNHSWK